MRGPAFWRLQFRLPPEPGGAAALHRAAPASSRRDFVVDLRGADEAPVAGRALGARASAVAAFGAGGLDARARASAPCSACRSGLRSWQAAGRLAEVWDGDIKLVAMGDRERDPA